MNTTPGDGTTGPNPASPENAANSATFGSTPATPTPPTRIPFLNKGTPPGFTAFESLSFKSALPVRIPNPGFDPSIERDGGTDWPGRNVVLKPQPRLVFSIPYSAAFPVNGIPGGKWIPLMYRTV